MRLHLLFRMAKTAAIYLLPIKSYSKNTHVPSFLEWAVVLLNYLELNHDPMHLGKEKLFIVPILRYYTNTRTTTIPTPQYCSIPILSIPIPLTKPSIDASIPTNTDAVNTRTKQFRRYPIPKSVGVGTCLKRTLFIETKK